MKHIFDFNNDGKVSVLENVYGLHLMNSVLNESRRDSLDGLDSDPDCGLDDLGGGGDLGGGMDWNF